jgi:small subunit ribosomal protein S2
MVTISIKSLLEAGVHFGHQSKKWNPKMKPFIYGEKDGLYIIDLQGTLEAFQKACQAVSDIVANGDPILLVGTKRQAQEIVAEEACRCGMPYITQRWVGGLLTNFSTVKRAIDRYNSFIKLEESGEIQRFTKKELAKFRREKERLEKKFKGVKDLDGLPGLIFVVDSGKEKIAIGEAKKMNIPVVAVVDTNGDPDIVDYCIPANDDAIKSIRLITSKIVDAVLEGKARFDEKKKVEEKEEKPQVKKEARPITAEEIEEQILKVAEREKKMKRPLARKRAAPAKV